MRVVSLLPSATEIICALGAGSTLVGRSEECDYPATVRELPVVMRTRALDSELDSKLIDERVRSSRAAGESLYTLDLDLLKSLRPDLIVSQDLCTVCSVTDSEVRVACQLAGIRPELLSLAPRRLDDVWESIENLGEAIGQGSQGRALAAKLRKRSDKNSTNSSTGPRVAVVEWIDPPILAGLWTPDIIGSAGGSPVGPAAGEPGHRTSWAAIEGFRPDLVVVAPCSFSVARTREELTRGDLTKRIGSVRPPRGMYLADEAYFSRPGPRLADGVQLVRNLLAEGEALGPMPVEKWTGGVLEEVA